MNTKLARYSWFVLTYNVLVIVWGAYVRATGSGAGCGAHWPLCNGEVVPRAPSAEMLVEFTHRVSSGLALVFVAVLFIWVWRAVASNHPARRGSLLSLVFILVEALLGAGLVLFRLVAQDDSLARAMMMPLHLVNTLLLLACLTLTAHWLSGGAAIRVTGRGRVAAMVAVALVAMIGVGKTGALAALGDTLFPGMTLTEGLAADLSSTSHLLLRLRILHPALAISVAVMLVFGIAALARTAGDRRDGRGGRARRAVVILAMVQVCFGFANLWMLAPVWMQMVHLLLADLLWIALVLTAASVLAAETSS